MPNQPSRRTRAASWATLLLVAALAATGCSARPGAADHAAELSATRVVLDPGLHVVAISVDGLNPAALSQLGSRRLPYFYRLIGSGASTLNARTEVELTQTLPNHTGMLTGRRVDARYGGHGIDFNSDQGSVTVSSAAGQSVRSVFSVVHGYGGSTALFASKDKFTLFQRSWPGSIDRFAVRYDNARLTELMRADLRDRARAFTFLHLSAPDVAGHATGFMGSRYLAAVDRVDNLLGTIITTVQHSPALRGHTYIVLTADHGGRGTHGHSQADSRDNYRVPFVIWGPKVLAGRNLYNITPTFQNPGTTRPGYAGRQPIRNGDLANVVTGLLGLTAVPGSQFDRGRTLTGQRP